MGALAGEPQIENHRGDHHDQIEIGQAYQTNIWPILGFFLMPLTTLAYAWAVNANGTVTDVVAEDDDEDKGEARKGERETADEATHLAVYRLLISSSG